MTAESYTTRAGVKQYRPVYEESELRDSMRDGNPGFCLACGLDCDGVEPDARGYRCESCGAPKVYGLEELLMMGLLKLA